MRPPYLWYAIVVKIRQALLLLSLITFFVYFSSFWNSFVWDDEQFIYSNSYVKNFAVDKIFTTSTTEGAGIISNYYRPLTTLSFAIDHAVWQLHPVGFHLTNILLHIAAGLLLFVYLKKIRIGTNGSFVIVLLFLLHPIQTEAVTYINSRGDSLFTVFGFLALNTFIQLLQSTRTKIEIAGIEFPFSPPFLVMLTSMWYVCSILSKEIGIIFGGLLFFTWLLEINFSKKNDKQTLSLKKLFNTYKYPIYALLICAGIAIGYLILRSTSLNFQNSFDFYQDESAYSQNIVVRLLTFSKVIFIYLGLFLVPFPLHMERSTEIITSLQSTWPWLFLITLLISTVFVFWRLKKSQPLAIFGLVWFATALLPVSGIVPINGILYEHWMYVPMIGICIFSYGVLKSLPLQIQALFRKYLVFLLVPLFIIYASLIIRQNYFWSSPIQLYTYLLQYTHSGRIYNNLAMAYADINQPELALLNYDKALSFGDVYPQIHHNKGNVYVQMNMTDKAIEEYKRAIELDPTFAFAYQRLLSIYLDLKDYKNAAQLVEIAESVFIYDQEWKKIAMQIKNVQLQNSASSSATTASSSATSPRGTAR